MTAPYWMALLPVESQDQEAGGIPMSAWVALEFTPHVALQDGALLLEVSKSLRLWGAVGSLQEALYLRLQDAGIPIAAIGQGDTALQASALLQLARAGTPLPTKIPGGLPLFTLNIAPAHVLALAHLGCHTWEDLQALPRAGVARRFGAATLHALDQAMGLQPHGLRWLVVPEKFDLSVELGAPAESAPALLYAASRLLQALQAWLRARVQGALAVEFSWKHELRRWEGVDLPAEGKILVRTAQPTQDIVHLRRLLGEHLERTRLAAPANQVRMLLRESAPWAALSENLLAAPPSGRATMAWHEFVERVGARLGGEQILVPEALEDHRPEAMQRWRPAALQGAFGSTEPAATGVSRTARLMPPWLVRPARLLAVREGRPFYHGRLRLLAGPERLETGWWNDPAPESSEPGLAVRDYFVAHNNAVGWVWIYRERLPGSGPAASTPYRWYLQGIYA